VEYKAIKTSPQDNVAIAVAVIPGGVTVTIPGDVGVVTSEEIPFGHKVALDSIPQGTDIIRYGEAICSARGNIKPGDWVHVHNTVSDI